MSGYEQLSMFTMSMEPTTAICCFGWGLASATPIETWMADLVPNGEYVIHVAGHPLVLRPAGITRKAIPCDSCWTQESHGIAFRKAMSSTTT